MRPSDSWRDSFTGPSEATKKLHAQLADVYIQLRQLEFPEVGALRLPIINRKPSYNCDPDDICVCHRPLSIKMMMQELEGINPGARIKPQVRGLVAAVRDRERALQVQPRLSQEWAKLEDWCHMAVVAALLSPDLTHDAYWDLVFYEAEESKPKDPDFDFREFYLRAIHPRLTAFMETPDRKALLAHKEEEQKRFFEEEKEYFNNPTVRSMLLPE
ncbi:hypothetical protein ACHAPT_010210 [Fusarium lateritium]